MFIKTKGKIYAENFSQTQPDSFVNCKKDVLTLKSDIKVKSQKSHISLPFAKSDFNSSSLSFM